MQKTHLSGFYTHVKHGWETCRIHSLVWWNYLLHHQIATAPMSTEIIGLWPALTAGAVKGPWAINSWLVQRQHLELA